MDEKYIIQNFKINEFFKNGTYNFFTFIATCFGLSAIYDLVHKYSHLDNLPMALAFASAATLAVSMLIELFFWSSYYILSGLWLMAMAELKNK